MPETATGWVHFFVPTTQPLGFADGFTLSVFAEKASWRIGEPSTARTVAPSVALAESPHGHQANEVRIRFIRTHVRDWVGNYMDDVADVVLRATGRRDSDDASSSFGIETHTTLLQIAVAYTGMPPTSGSLDVIPLADTSFDSAISAARYILRLYSYAYGTTALITRDTIPILVPMFVEPSDTSTEGIGIYVNERSSRDIRGAIIGPAKVPAIFDMGHDLARGRPFQDFRRLLDEATTSLDFYGGYTASAVLYGAAAESLLDEALLLILWHDAVPPDDAATVFHAKRIVARVKSEFSGRIGGNWAIDRIGPAMDWFTATANLRNRVVHSGYEPTRPEVHASRGAVLKLVQHFRNIFGKKENVARYPLLAYALLSHDEFAKKAVKSVDARAAAADRFDRWADFDRWRDKIPKEI